MAIFRGVGGSGDSSDNSFLDAVTTQANAASASASAASASASAASTSASSILNLTAATGAAGSSASYNASTGVLTIPKGDTGDVNNLTSEAVTNVLTGGTGISIASNGTITNDSPDQTVALTGAGGTSITGTYPNFTITSSSTLTDAQIKTAYENNADTNAFTDADHTKLDGIDTSIYLTSFDITTQTDPKYLRADTADSASGFIQFSSGFSATTGTFTGGISATTAGFTGNVTVDGTVDGRDLAVDGTKLDGLKGTLTTNYWDAMQWAQGASRVLTTTLTQYGTTLYVKHSGDTYKTYVDLSLDLLHSVSSGTNDAYGHLAVTAPSPSSETTINMGACTHITSGVSYIRGFTLVGDWTEYFSPYMGISKNSDGSSPMAPPYKWYYNPSTNTTGVWVSLYTNAPANGDTIYFHPFDWESSGTVINGETLTLDNSSGTSVHNRRDFKIYLGRFDSRVGYAFKARETSSTDYVALDSLRMSTTEYEV